MTTLTMPLVERAAIFGWIAKHRNLLLVRKRMRAQLPGRYRRGFYNTWVLSHLGVRRRQIRMPSEALSPLTIKVSPTMRCNLSCIGCFAGAYPVETDMPAETLKSIVHQAAAMGIPSVGIIGGEPLLVPGIFDLFRECRNVGFYIATNGTRVDPRVVENLTELPHVITAFSVDGFQETNDRLRGEGVFRKIVNAMSMMKEAGLAFGFSTTVDKANLSDVVSEEFLDFMIDRGCLFGAFLPYIPVGRTPQYHLVCDQSEVREYYHRLDLIGASRALLILKEGYSDGTFLNSGCGAGHTMHITEKGEAEPCNGIEFFTDNINRSTLKDIFTSGYFRDIRALHPKDHRACLVIAHPEAVLRVVENHAAAETHIGAMSHLKEYIGSLRERTSAGAGVLSPHQQD